MKFLAKDPHSPILAESRSYKEHGHNAALREALLTEQHGYCAYTEKIAEPLDTVAVEHFDRSLKGTARDGYFNHYAVLQSANQRKRKKEARYEGARFFETRFFQKPGELQRRVRYVAEEHVYEEVSDGDGETADLIDYLGFNDEPLVRQRRCHVRMLADLFEQAQMSDEARVAWLAKHRTQASFITALETALGLDLSSVLE